MLEGISFHLHASGRLSDEERDAALLSVAGRCEDIVRRRVQERCYIPSLLLSALVFLLVYLFLSLAVRDPVPMVDELLAASVLSVLCFTLIRRRAAGGALYRNIMLSCRRELGILREDEDEAIGRLEDYYESLCRYDIQAMADILAHRGGENPPPFRGGLTEGQNVSPRDFEPNKDIGPGYLAPYHIFSNNRVYNGYRWMMAHYLDPVAVQHFLITGNGSIDASPLYQNPGWPTQAGLGAQN